MPYTSGLLSLVVLGWLAWLIALPLRPSVVSVALSAFVVILMASLVAARRMSEPWRAFVRRTADVHGLLAVLAVALAVQCADTHGVTTDGVIYFSQLRSVIFDRDLDVAAEFAYLNQPPRPSHVVPIGPTFVWLPLYLVVAAVDAIGRALQWWSGPAEPAGVGLTLPYIRAALLSSFAIGAVGVMVIHRRLRAEFASAVALCGSLLLFLATPLVWYMVYEPSMTHASSFGFVALFVIAAERHTAVRMSARQSALLGALLGLAFMTRPQEAVFALFPATLLLMDDEPWAARVRAAGRLAGAAFLGALPFLMAQAVHSSILMRHEAFALAGEGGYLNFLGSRWPDTLWSSWHGFFSWTPIAYLAFVALFFYAARNRRWAVAGILIVLVMAWVNGATTDWAGGWSFGGRRFISVLVALAPAFALLVRGLVRRPLVALGVIGGLAIVWNQLLIAQYRDGRLPHDPPATFGQIVRQQAAQLTRPPFFYPFAFPANLWFAWRTGLPVDRYDLLGPEPLGAAMDLPMSTAGKYLLDGWGARTSDPFGELRWIDGPRAELVLPFDPAADRPYAIDVQARTRLVEGAPAVTFALLVNGHEVGTVTPDMQQPSTASFTLAPRANALGRGFNRVVLERRAGGAPVGIYRISIQ